MAAIFVKRARHDGCGGRAWKVELLTDIAPFCEPSPDGWDDTVSMTTRQRRRAAARIALP